MRLKHLIAMVAVLAGFHAAAPRAASAQNPGGITTAPLTWYKAESLSALAGGANVASWADSTGSARTAAQATTVNQPTYNASGIAGRPSVHFPGTSGVRLVTGQFYAISPFFLSQPYTVIAVVKAATITGTQVFFDGGSNNQSAIGFKIDGTNQKWDINSGNGTVLNSTVTPDTSAHVITTEWSGTSSTIRVDGASLVSGTVGTASLSAITLGNRSDGTQPFSGEVGEVLVYGSLLSSSDRAAVENYLVGKFAATSFNAYPSTVPASRTGLKIHLTGSGTSWTSGTTFSATGATVTATAFTNAGSVDLTLTTGTAGTITFSDSLDAATAAITSVAAQAPDSTGVFFEPGSLVSAGNFAEWIDTAAGAKLSFFGTSLSALYDPTLLLTGGIAALSYPYLDWSIDGGGWQRAQAGTGGVAVLATGLASATHTAEVRLEPAYPPTDTWTPKDALRLTGWRIDGGASLSSPSGAAALRPKRALLFGDSITFGVSGSNVALTSYGALLGSGLNAEIGIVGKPGQGWEHVATDGSPVFPTTFDNYFSGQARTFETLDYLLVMQGTNDASMSASTVSAWLVDARAKAPSPCAICVILPYRTQVNATITSGFNTYTAAHPSDTKMYLIDIAARYGDWAKWVPGGYHPNDEGHAVYASMLLNAIQAAATPPATGGTKRRVQ